MNKAIIIAILLCLPQASINAQQHDSLLFLKTESTWGSEIFHFPIKFAPDINFEGYEDARFPEGWRNTESEEFWSYAFAWNVNLMSELSGSQLEENIKIYFNGLMNDVNRDESIVVPKTTALFVKNEVSNSGQGYKGKVKIFDAFTTQKSLTLHVTVDQYYCEEKRRSIVLFKFSPMKFGSNIWRVLEQIQPLENVCE